jgi:hypothetical protein
MLEDIRHKWSLRHRPARPAPAPIEPSTSAMRPGREPQGSECETEHWKRQVEAEARHRLKRYVRGIGARSS